MLAQRLLMAARKLVKGLNIAGDATASLTSGGPSVTPNPERLNDGTLTGQSEGTNADQDNVEYRFDFGVGNAKIIHSYSLFGPSSGNAPRDYTLEGSHDAYSNVDILDTRSGESALGTGVERAHDDIGNIAAYRYYRINSTAPVTGAGETRLSEVRLFQGV